MTTPIAQSISDEQLAELADGCIDSIPCPISALYELAERLIAAEADAKRYRWLRNPDQDVSLVLDKVSGEVPADEFGCGGYLTYEYRSGDELDAAIDAAMERTP
ncbi:hypothetical protein JR315_28985 [Pseudomonas aeruginosa]|uniref:hypothetical protein n=1 Tax=Pseudomonas aeruginosa TaxID=287 RepID=UPI0022EAB4E2|nr:hypothetical protein [Pseudomonas aeruginosa]MDA3170292.1 hypothetical protein [Pseudomonas aeruginosa]